MKIFANIPASKSRENLSNSCQNDGKSEMQSESWANRRNTRRRAPVDKLGGVMIGWTRKETNENPKGERKVKFQGDGTYSSKLISQGERLVWNSKTVPHNAKTTTFNLYIMYLNFTFIGENWGLPIACQSFEFLSIIRKFCPTVKSWQVPAY